MFGLSELTHAYELHSTLDKALFIAHHVWAHGHGLTTAISFGALGVLVIIRSLKTQLKKYWFIYRLPEVLIVVVCSTSKFECGISDVEINPNPDAVMSDKFNWDQDGVEILGNVPINTGSTLVHFPLRKVTLRYLRRTTSTAV